MNASQNHSLRTALQLGIAILWLSILAFLCPPANAQVRVKKPDRGVYDPAQGISQPTSPRSVSKRQSSPTMKAAEVNPIQIEPVHIRPVQSSMDAAEGDQHEDDIANGKLSVVRDTSSLKFRSLDEVANQPSHKRASLDNKQDSSYGTIQQTSYAAPIVQTTPSSIRSPGSIRRQWIPTGRNPQRVITEETLIDHSGYPIHNEGWVHGSMNDVIYDSPCDGCGDYSCVGCGDYGCDSYGACGDGRVCNASLCFDPCNWFGSLELLLMFRKGDVIPPLVTNDGPTSGAVANPDVLFGGNQLFDEMTAGFRLTLGTWLDRCQYRSLVFRLWTSTEAGDSFSGAETLNSGGILSIPTTQAGVADLALIAFPDDAQNFGRFGSISASATSNVYGGDVSVRQFWTGGLGTTYDVLYGYQYMRLDEDLRLNTNSTITQENLPLALGDNVTTQDHFDTTNEFHGGQFGLAGRYREGCWSFDFLAKLGFGQVRRQTQRTGSTVITTTNPPDVNAANTGILVQDSNSGSVSDDTFGWVPELDVSLGWHYFPRFDVTFGYTFIAMTDTARISGALDPGNDVDAPRRGLDYETFYLQSLHFGIEHVY